MVQTTQVIAENAVIIRVNDNQANLAFKCKYDDKISDSEGLITLQTNPLECYQDTLERLLDGNLSGVGQLTDTDNDTVLDLFEIDSDTDGDQTPNINDTDDDNDGILTKNEIINADTDNDKIPNYLDNDDDGDGVFPESATLDTDSNSVPNYLDNDDDGDGILTKNESKTLDSDGDGIPDYLDPDQTVIQPPSGVLTLADSSRTILPDCVNGVVFNGLFPACIGDVGVGKGDSYIIKLNFKDIFKTVRMSGEFKMDQTTRGAYNMSISEVPGNFGVTEGCRDMSGSFASVSYVNQAEIDYLVANFNINVSDLLQTRCKLDLNKQYYLNVDVISSCQKDDSTKAICWGSIIQKSPHFDL